MGAILARATSVTDSMVEASSLGLAESLTPEERGLGLIYPHIDRSTSSLTQHFLFSAAWSHRVLPFTLLVREISAFIAKEVIRAAQKAVSLPLHLASVPVANR